MHRSDTQALLLLFPTYCQTLHEIMALAWYKQNLKETMQLSSCVGYSPTSTARDKDIERNIINETRDARRRRWSARVLLGITAVHQFGDFGIHG
jgi:hypothetical protein